MGAKWLISLSNGETILEDNNRLNDIYSDNRSPYQKLMQYCEDNGLKITGIRLQVNGVTHTFSSSPKAKFPTVLDIKEIGYRRRAELTAGGGTKEESYIRYYVIIGCHKFSLWLDEKTGDSWLNVEKISQTSSDIK